MRDMGIWKGSGEQTHPHLRRVIERVVNFLERLKFDRHGWKLWPCGTRRQSFEDIEMVSTYTAWWIPTMHAHDKRGEVGR